MNTILLRAARRYSNGTREWLIPGAGNSAKLSPRSFWGDDVPAFAWPHKDAEGHEVLRKVRLDWHRSIAKAEARKLIAAYSEA